MTEEERVRRFESAYNRLDKSLIEMAGQQHRGRRRTYASKVRIAANRFPRLAKHVDFLLEIGELRNAIVHNRLGDGVYIAVPHESAVQELEEIERRISAPPRVIPRFKRAVHVLDADDTLDRVFELVRTAGHSRYPVYENGSFIGLLTSNGIARWCATAAKNGRLEVDGREITVRDVLPSDRRRDDVMFASASTAIDDVAEMFRANARLEAVIITRKGRLTEDPLGFICAADLLLTDA